VAAKQLGVWYAQSRRIFKKGDGWETSRWAKKKQMQKNVVKLRRVKGQSPRDYEKMAVGKKRPVNTV
jgi:hypothetical protein